MGKAASNEQRKLTATYINSVAVALVAVGVFAPFAALITGAAASGLGIVFMAVGCFAGILALRYAARRLIAGVED